jgi:DNA replication protein DnaC
LVNELVEARQHNAVKRVLARWLRYDVIVLDEVGYVPLAVVSEKGKEASQAVRLVGNWRYEKTRIDRCGLAWAKGRNGSRQSSLRQVL